MVKVEVGGVHRGGDDDHYELKTKEQWFDAEKGAFKCI